MTEMRMSKYRDSSVSFAMDGTQKRCIKVHQSGIACSMNTFDDMGESNENSPGIKINTEGCSGPAGHHNACAEPPRRSCGNKALMYGFSNSAVRSVSIGFRNGGNLVSMA